MLKKHILTLCLALTLLVTSTQADWLDRFFNPKKVSLSKLLKNPESYLNVPVSISLRFQRVNDIYTPFFTLFNREEHWNFSAWDIETPIWRKKGFLNDYPFFYVHKDNKEFKTFLRLKKFETVTVIGRIMSIFKGKPYFNIVYVCRMEGDLNIHNLTLLNRTMRYFRHRQFDKALSYSQKVLLTSPPSDIKAFLHKLNANIYLYYKKNFSLAVTEAQKGLELVENDSQLKSLLTSAQYFKKHGGTPIPPDELLFIQGN